jgi:hypothetical protein
VPEYDLYLGVRLAEASSQAMWGSAHYCVQMSPVQVCGPVLSCPVLCVLICLSAGGVRCALGCCLVALCSCANGTCGSTPCPECSLRPQVQQLLTCIKLCIVLGLLTDAHLHGT